MSTISKSDSDIDSDIVYDLTVIGAGPGGYAAAFLAADLGLKVALIDKEKNPGGVCLYKGCIPSKALLHLSKLLYEAKEAESWGITFAPPTIDLTKIRDYKNSVIQKLTGGLGHLTKKREITYIEGEASFKESQLINVKRSDGSTSPIKTKKTIIAIGSTPITLPNLNKDSPRVLDSTSALNLESIPKTLLVVGGGYIGLELGQVYASLGSKVKVVERLPQLLPAADRDLVTILQKSLQKKFEQILTSTSITNFTELPDGIEVTFEPSQSSSDQAKTFTEKFEKILVSIGRRVDTSSLNLSATKVEVSSKGFIVVNDTLLTADPSIYAIGDVVGGVMLAHKAAAEGKVAVEALLGHKVVFEPLAIPAVVFTDPELAWCGYTEEEAKAKGIVYEVARFPWSASGKATSISRTEGLTKLIIEKESEKIIGVAICGPGAGDMISEGTLAIEMGATAKDISLTIHPHPTLSETLAGAAESFYGQATDLYKPKRK